MILREIKTFKFEEDKMACSLKVGIVCQHCGTHAHFFGIYKNDLDFYDAIDKCHCPKCNKTSEHPIEGEIFNCTMSNEFIILAKPKYKNKFGDTVQGIQIKTISGYLYITWRSQVE